ncbi:MAG: hypothetical protein WCV99_13955 [Sterolibacterium sp.]|jgi:hypothetical protein
MKSKVNMAMVALSAALLSACGSIDSAAYQTSGASHSLSLVRTKTFAWSGEWELALVTAHAPECQRRHKLLPVSGPEFKVDLYRSLEGNYILRQGNNWYVTETRACRLQKFPAPPREPGDLLGVFEESTDGIKFTAAPAAATPPAALAAPAQSPAPALPIATPPPAIPPAAAPVTR